MTTTMDLGYDVEVISSDYAVMYCIVCTKLMREPMQFSCTHGTCKPCYKDIVQQSNEKSIEPACPSCNKNICSDEDHYKACRPLLPSSNETTAPQSNEEQIICPYAGYGCTKRELTEKNIDRHLSEYAGQHLDLCTNILNKDDGRKDALEFHKNHMQQSCDNISTLLQTINQMAQHLQQTNASGLDVVKDLYLDPFHRVKQSVNCLEEYMIKAEGFVSKVEEYVSKFNKKSFLSLSMHNLLCGKTSVCDIFRIDRKRLCTNHAEHIEQLKSLKNSHHHALVCMQNMTGKITKKEKGIKSNETKYTEECINHMQQAFDEKVDRVVDTLNDAMTGISTSYRFALLDFIDDPEKPHNYTDYYIWKIDTTAFQRADVRKEYYKDVAHDITKSETQGGCLTVWSTIDVPDMNYDSRDVAEGKLMVKYILQVYKSYIAGSVYLFSQMEMDRITPSQTVISKVKVEQGSLYSILAEFPLDQIKKTCRVDGVMYFNTVVT